MRLKIERTDGNVISGIIEASNGSKTQFTYKVLGMDGSSFIVEDPSQTKWLMKVFYTSSYNTLIVDSMKVISGGITPPEPPDPPSEKFMRVQFSDPSFDPTGHPTMLSSGWEWNAVSLGEGIWDLLFHKEGTDWSNTFNALDAPVFVGQTIQEEPVMGDVTVDILSADFTGATNLSGFFRWCTQIRKVGQITGTGNVTDTSYMFQTANHSHGITKIQLFDTSSVTNMSSMFRLSKIDSIPLFDTGSCANMTEAFYGCSMVESGSLDLYTQASTQENPPSSYTDCFNGCGSGTETGAAELAQIPTSWGGTMA